MELEHIALWPEGAPYAQGDGPDDQPYLTPYLLTTAEPVSAVIVLPGGGYGRKAPHEGEPVSQWLNSLGIASFVLQYRVAPYMHPVPLLDAQRAIRLVRSNAAQWGIDPNRIGILGFSAGGHLASTAGTHYDSGNPESADPVERVSCRPDIMVLCYPVISLERFTHQGSRRNLLGEEPDEELVRFLSSEQQITGDTPPAFLWHTADDAAVPVENSLLISSALASNKVPFDLHVFESGRHGLGLAADHPEAREWPQLCAGWLRKRGF